MSKNKIVLLCLFVLGIGFSGCAPKMPKASLQEDQQAKTFKLDPDKSNLYICRNEYLGHGVNMTLLVDGRYIGKTEGYSYFYLKLNPGKHKIQSITENVSTVVLDTEKNKNYFVWHEVKMGNVTQDSKLHIVNAEHEYGKNCVLKTVMLKENKE